MLRGGNSSSPPPAQLAGEGRWATTCQSSTRIKVWYHPYYEGDAARARAICELMEGTIWPKLVTELMQGRAPYTDGVESNNGGDYRFDIYLVNAGSATVSYRQQLENTPTYMLVNRAGASDGLGTITHTFSWKITALPPE